MKVKEKYQGLTRPQLLENLLKQMPIPEVQRLDGDGFVGASVDSEDMFLFATDGGAIGGNGVLTDGQIAALNRQNGQIKWFLCVGGTGMKVDDQELFRSDGKVTIALDNSGNGQILKDSTATGRETVNVTITFGGAEAVKLIISSGTTVVKHGRPLQ